MSIKQAYLIELERETANTKKLLDVIEDQHLDYKPHPKSFSMGQLAAHIVELHNWVALALNKDALDFATDYTPFQPTSIQEIKDVLDNSYTANVAQIEQMTEEDWMQEWTLKHGDHIIAQMPKIGTMRYIIMNHLIHHRGQLSVYLRMNDLPVPGIFGPSADEQNA